MQGLVQLTSERHVVGVLVQDVLGVADPGLVDIEVHLVLQVVQQELPLLILTLQAAQHQRQEGLDAQQGFTGETRKNIYFRQYLQKHLYTKVDLIMFVTLKNISK